MLLRTVLFNMFYVNFSMSAYFITCLRFGVYALYIYRPCFLTTRKPLLNLLFCLFTKILCILTTTLPAYKTPLINFKHDMCLSFFGRRFVLHLIRITKRSRLNTKTLRSLQIQFL